MALFKKEGSDKSGTKKSLEIVDKVKKDVEKYAQPIFRLKKEEEEAYHGAIWKNISGYRPYENEIFEIVETQVPLQTDSFPAPTVEVTEESKRPQAKNLERAIQWVNEDQDFILKLPELVRAAEVAGPGWLHIYYDQNEDNGNGKDIYECVHYSRVKVGGPGNKIETASKLRLELDRTKEWLKLTYPALADKIDKLKGKEQDKEDSFRGYESHDSGAGYGKRTVPPRYRDDDVLEFVKTYIKDYTIEAIPPDVTEDELADEYGFLSEGDAPDISKWQDHKAHIEKHKQDRAELCAQLELPPDAPIEMITQVAEELVQTNPEAADAFASIPLKVRVLDSHSSEHEDYLRDNPKSGRLKYKNGLRCIETVERVVLYDGPSKDDHAMIPLAPFYAYTNDTFYGASTVRNLLDSARMKATLTYETYKGLVRMANPVKEVNTESGLTKDDVTNEAGAVYEVKEGTAWSVRNISPGDVSQQSIAWQEGRVEKMKDISGTQNPLTGELPNSQVSEVTVTKTQNQAMARIRLKDRQTQHYSIKRMGKILASNIIQYWTSEKVLYLEESEGNFEQIIFNPLEMQDLQYDIKISSGSMAGIDKEQFNVFATSLLNSQQITFKQFAEIADLPKIEKLRQFAEENDQVAAQMQELQAQMEQMQQESQAAIAQLQEENLRLKTVAAPDTLNNEESKIVDQLIKDDEYSRITGVNNDQPEDIGA